MQKDEFNSSGSKQFHELPANYREENKNQGSVERVEYYVPDLENGKTEKYCNVYLPYGYDTSDSIIKYDVLYLMHGGGEDENLLFGGPGQNRELKNILDNMIASGEIEPLIVVTPTFYGVKNNLKNNLEDTHIEALDHPLPLIETEYYHHELISDLVPFIETKYHTYTKSAKKEDLQATRNHRAFGGFSMGAVTTWYTFIHCLDYFKYFVPLCGDCWSLIQKGEGKRAKETAVYLSEIAGGSIYTPKDYFIFGASGRQDIAYPSMKPQMEAMKELKDTFMNNGNFYFIENFDGVHTWHWVNQFIFNILPDLFRE